MGHKLMVLGSTSEFSPLVKRTQERGISVVCCDGYADGPAKAIADERYDIDIRDHDSIAKLAKSIGVDGIISAFSDNLPEQCAAIAPKAGLSFYLPAERLAILRDKSRMKEMFSELGVRFPKTVVAKRPSIVEDIASLEFPVVTKPLNGWGSHGVFVLNSAEEVVERFEDVAKYSGGDAILVEEYNDGFELNTMSWVVDGSPVILEIADREKTADEPRAIPHVSRIVYPSVLTDVVIDDIRGILTKVAHYVGLQNGPLCMQAFWSPERGIQVCECAGRVFGTEHEMLEYATNGALTVEDLLIDTVYDVDNLKVRLAGHDPHLQRTSCGLFWHGKEGRISQMGGFPEVGSDECAVDTLEYYAVGDVVHKGEQPYVVRSYIVAPRREELDELTDTFFESAYMRNEAGESMLYDNERMDYSRAFGDAR